ncbi:peptidyl-alpha-hydroxyglycine alpha-amidating lyase family protein [Natronorarus salvus]|uniref:peptidyl-alpha-hydroxyglycine alpha-amidating lyase family protein n=1 Tax=Natronorarus salvus TaxID=3117733 RepID=UPI002F264349
MIYGSGDYTYELVSGWAEVSEGESFRDVGGVRVDEEDRVLVLNRSGRPVMVFDATGERLSSWGDDYFSDRPHGLGLDAEGNVYCTDDGNHTVRKFTPDGELLLTLGTEDEPAETGYRHDAPDLFERIASITRGAGPFNGPTGVAVSASGEIFVADGYGNARVHAFDPDGEHLRSWGQPGPAPGEFRLPHSIYCDGEDRLWVTDRENSRIQVFDTSGELVAEWTDLIRPTDVVVDDAVFVSELCRRVSVFTADGELLTRWGNERHPTDDPLFVAPHAIAVDSNGDLYVGEVSYTYKGIDRGPRAIQKFERRD